MVRRFVNILHINAPQSTKSNSSSKNTSCQKFHLLWTKDCILEVSEKSALAVFKQEVFSLSSHLTTPESQLLCSFKNILQVTPSNTNSQTLFISNDIFFLASFDTLCIEHSCLLHNLFLVGLCYLVEFCTRKPDCCNQSQHVLVVRKLALQGTDSKQLKFSDDIFYLL